MLKKQFITLLLALVACISSKADPYCNTVWGGVGFPDDPTCEASVCSYDPYCCTDNWDSLCATEAANDSNCSGCLSLYTNTHPYCNEGGNGTGFPADPGCQASVCSYDPYCCNNNWDGICASEAADDSNCTGCLKPLTNTHPYCDEVGNGTGFLADPVCQASVCSYDNFCCETHWDGICASEASSDPNCASCHSGGCVPTSNTITVSACSEYYWAENDQNYYETGLYSVETDCHTEYLDLTIIPGTVVSLNGTTNVCIGGIINLIATGGNTYQWSGPNGYTNVGGSITRSGASLTMSGTYTVTITNNICSVVLSIEVTVHPKPSATLTGATSVCSGGTITLTAPGGAASYQWSGPNGFTSNTGDVNTLVRTPANTTMSGVYKVTVTNIGGCTATASRTVTVTAPTNATITGASSFCAGSMITLTATTAGVDYQWSGPGGYTQSGAVLSRGPATSAMAGAYKVTVTNASGCISTASKTITISAVPNVAITNNSNCTRIWLIASGGNSYSWSGPGYTGSGSTVLRNPATAAMYGTYTVTVTGSGGCTASASITVTACGGGGNEKNEGIIAAETLKIFPNPVYTVCTVSFSMPTNQAVRLSVYAIDGKEVAVLYNYTTEAHTTYQLEFDVAELPNGIYYAVLRRADGSTEQTPILVTK